MVSLRQLIEQTHGSAGMGSRKKMDWEQEKKTFQRIFFEEDGAGIKRRNNTPPKSEQKFSADYITQSYRSNTWHPYTRFESRCERRRSSQ